MSYAAHKSRVFRDAGDAPDLVPKRSDGRLKNYTSATDARVWAADNEDRRQHILDLIKADHAKTGLGKYVPIEVLVDTLLANKTAECEKIKEELAAYKQLPLTPEQTAMLNKGQQICFDDEIPSTSTGVPTQSRAPMGATARTPMDTSAPVDSRAPMGAGTRAPTVAKGGFSDLTDMESLKRALQEKEAECCQQRSIATRAIEQLENIKGIIEERDELKRLLQSSQTELGTMKKKFAAFAKEPCVEEIAALENEINQLKDQGLLNAEAESNMIRKEITVLKRYCSKLSAIQEENYNLKTQLAQYNEFAGTSTSDVDTETSDDLNYLKKKVNELKNQLHNVNQVMEERDRLKQRVKELEGQLMQYTNLPQELDSFRQRSDMLDNVLEERDSLRERLNRLKVLENEVIRMKEKADRVDELERELASYRQGSSQHPEQSICSPQSEDIDKLKQKAKEADALRAERNRMKVRIEELTNIEVQFAELLSKACCVETIKNERDMYKAKYEEIVGLECQCDNLQGQVQKYKQLEQERDQLLSRIRECETYIGDQEEEIKKLVAQIDERTQSSKQEYRMQQALGEMRSELDKKNKLIQFSDEQLSKVQDELEQTIDGVSSQASGLRTRIIQLEKAVQICEEQKQDIIRQAEEAGVQVHVPMISVETFKDSEKEEFGIQAHMKGTSVPTETMGEKCRRAGAVQAHTPMSSAATYRGYQSDSHEIQAGIPTSSTGTYGLSQEMGTHEAQAQPLMSSTGTHRVSRPGDSQEVQAGRRPEMSSVSTSREGYSLGTQEVQAGRYPGMSSVSTSKEGYPLGSQEVQAGRRPEVSSVSTSREGYSLGSQEVQAGRYPKMSSISTSREGYPVGTQEVQAGRRPEMSSIGTSRECKPLSAQEVQACRRLEMSSVGTSRECQPLGIQEVQASSRMGTRGTSRSCTQLNAEGIQVQPSAETAGMVTSQPIIGERCQRALANVQTSEPIIGTRCQRATLAKQRMKDQQAEVMPDTRGIGLRFAPDADDEGISAVCKPITRPVGSGILNVDEDTKATGSGKVATVHSDATETPVVDEQFGELLEQSENAIEAITQQLESVQREGESIEELKKRIRELENQLSNCASTIEDLKKKLQDCLDLKAENQELRRVSLDIQDSAKDEMLKLMNQLKQCQEKIKELEARLRQAEAQQPIVDRGTNCDELKAELDRMREENQRLLAQIKTLEGIVKGEGDITTLSKDNAELSRKLKDAEAAIADLKKQLSRISDLEEELRKCREKCAQLEQENIKLASAAGDTSQLDALRKERDALKKQIQDLIAEIEGLKARLAGGITDADLAKEKKDKQDLQDLINQLQNQLKAMGKGESDLQAMIDELRKKLAACESKNADMSAKLASADRSKEIDDLLAKLKKCQDENSVLNSENGRLKQDVAAISKGAPPPDRSAEIADLMAKLKKCQDDNANLAQQMKKCQDESASLATQLKNAQAASPPPSPPPPPPPPTPPAAPNRQNEIDDLLAKLKKCQDDNAALAADNTKLKNEVQSLTAEASRLKQDVAALSKGEKPPDRSAEIADLMAKLKKCQEDNAAITAEAAKLKQDMAGMSKGDKPDRSAEIDDLLAKLKKCQEDNSALQTRIATAEAENKKLKDENSSLNSQMTQLNQQLQAAMTGDNSDLLREIDRLNKLIRDLEEAKRAAEKECADAIAALKAQYDRDLKAIHNKYNDGVAKLQDSHEELVKEIAKDHEQEVKTLTRELRTSKEKIAKMQQAKRKPSARTSVTIENVSIKSSIDKGNATCRCGSTLKSILYKILSSGMEALTTEELRFLQAKTTNVLNRRSSAGGECVCNKERNYSIPQSGVRSTADYSSKSGASSKLDPETTKADKQLMNEEGKAQQYMDIIEREGEKIKQLQSLLDNERIKVDELKTILTSQRDRAKEVQKLESEAIENMRVKLEKYISSDITLKMQLDQSSKGSHPCTCSQSSASQPQRKNQTSFYTELTVQNVKRKQNFVHHCSMKQTRQSSTDRSSLVQPCSCSGVSSDV